MRIDNNARIQDATELGQAKSNSPAVTGSGANLAADTVALSISQGAVQALAAKVSEMPEVRQERVAALAQAIRDGSYQVSPEQAAEALMAHMKQVPTA